METDLNEKRARAYRSDEDETEKTNRSVRNAGKFVNRCFDNLLSIQVSKIQSVRMKVFVYRCKWIQRM